MKRTSSGSLRVMKRGSAGATGRACQTGEADEVRTIAMSHLISTQPNPAASRRTVLLRRTLSRACGQLACSGSEDPSAYFYVITPETSMFADGRQPARFALQVVDRDDVLERRDGSTVQALQRVGSIRAGVVGD
ncbi:MAG: hypothetical protein K6T83_20685, partial [Alicyclobacillus sp.]|nr:hypothetical protein [Alicyclobacillus sp.]